MIAGFGIILQVLHRCAHLGRRLRKGGNKANGEMETESRISWVYIYWSVFKMEDSANLNSSITCKNIQSPFYGKQTS